MAQPLSRPPTNSEQSPRTNSEQSPPTPYYGWRIAWALALTQTVGYGVLYYGFGVFIKPMEAEFGWSRTQTSGAFSLALLVAGLAAIPVGHWIDRQGARGLMTLGSGLAALTLLGWSQIHSLLGLYLVALGLGLAMAAVLYEVAFTVVAVWFRKERPRALLIVTLTAGLASTIFIPLITWLVNALAWRVALEILALILALSTIPLHALVLRHRPQDLGLEPDGIAILDSPQPSEPSISAQHAYRMPAFWWLVVAVALARMAASAIGVHLVALLLERGYVPGLVAAAAGSIGLMQLAGRIFFTPLSSRLSLHTLATLTFGLHALALLVLLTLPGMAGVWIFAAFFGISNGAITLARATLLAETFGPLNYGRLNGTIALVTAFTSAAAPILAGVIHQTSGGYTAVLALLTLTTALSALAVSRVRHSLR